MTPHILDTLRQCAKDDTSYQQLVALYQEVFQGNLQDKRPLIAIVDDDPTITEHLTQMLRDAGFHTQSYCDGESFVSCLGDTAPGLILLDLRLPGMEGGDVFHNIHKNDATRRTPVIFITGQISPEDEQKLNEDLKANVQYLAKPFTRDSLLALVNRMLLDNAMKRSK